MFFLVKYMRLFLIALISISNASWEPVAFPANVHLSHVNYLSPDRILVFAKRINNTEALAYLSVDSGSSWQIVSSVSEGKYTDSHFLDSQTGWLIGHSYNPFPQDYYYFVRKTIDGGFTWLADSGWGVGFLDDIHMVSTTTGMSVGMASGLATSFILKYNGSSWTESVELNGVNIYDEVLSSVFFDGVRGIILSETQDSVYLTIDGGAKWFSRFVPTGYGSGRKMHFIDANHGWIIAGAKFLRTIDGGNSWSDTTFSTFRLTDIHFNSVSNGWLCDVDGRIYNSTNGGQTWNLQANVNEQLNSISFLDDQNGIAVGQSGTFYKTTNGGIVGISESQISIHESTFSLLPNYPNPFNPSTTLRFELQRRSDVLLQITDVSGRHVRMLVNDARSAGLHEVNWDGRDDAENPVASGVYFSRLESRGVVQSQKLLLIR